MISTTHEIDLFNIATSIISGEKAPIGFYRKSRNRIFLIKFFVEKCLYLTPDTLRPISVHDFKKYNLFGFLITYYNGSPRKVLMEAYPDILLNNNFFSDPKIVCNGLIQGQISEAPRNFWSLEENKILTTQYLVSFLQKDIYAISSHDFIKNHLGGFLQLYYKGSVNSALQQAYPDLKPFLFQKINKKIWDDEKMVIEASLFFFKKIPKNTKITWKLLISLGLKLSLKKKYNNDLKLFIDTVEKNA